MKKLIILLLSFMPFLITSAQVDTIAVNVYENNGMLGIGTPFPATKLHMVESIDNNLLRIESSEMQAGIQLIANENHKPFLNFGVNGLPGSLGTMYYDVNFKHIAFRAHTEFAETREMVLNENGFVGIATKTPLSRLEVNGTVHSTLGGFKFPDGTIQTTAANSSSSYWNSLNSNEIFTTNKVGIDRTDFQSYFPYTKLWVHNGWLQVSDSADRDAGIVVTHLKKSGYGFARSLHQVYSGVDGDAYTEFRVRNNNEAVTDQSWSIGIDNSDDNKLKITSRTNHPTGASPSYGDQKMTITANGNIGIGTDNPNTKLHMVESVGNNLLRIESSEMQAGIQLIANENHKPFLNFGVNGLPGSLGTMYYDVNFKHIAFRAHTEFAETREMVLNENGYVGIGTKTPLSRLEVNGTVHSTLGGFKFPDGTIQTTAANPSSSYWNSLNSNEIFTSNKVGIDRTDFQSYFPYTKLWVHNGWLQVSDSADRDAGIVVTHLKKSGYGFARSLHQVYSGVDGDAYTEFRVRNNNDAITDQSWSIGIDNSDDNKLKITSRTNHPTGASPSYGDQKMTITADGNIGIGTDNPLTKLQVSDGDIFISDIDRGIIMKSPDGKCWRGTLDNSGTLVFSSFDCPGEISFNSISKTPQEVTGSISIFPNPIDHTITIYSDSENLSKSTAIFYTTDGKVVRKDELNSNYNILNMTNIPAGSYIINVINKRGKILGHELVIKK